MGIATQYEGGLRFEGDQMYITTGSSTIMTIKSGGTIQLPQYSAGLLQTDASGNVSVDTSSYLTSYTETDTLSSVVSRGASTTSAITVGGITSGNASLNGTVQLGSFNGNNEDQWPIVQWYRDSANNWDEGLIKASSNRGFFSTSHFGIHFDSSRAFGFFTSSWTKVLGISSSKVLSEVDLEIGSGETLIHGELRLGTHPVHSGYTGLWNTEASTTTTSQYLIISAGTDTYINGDNVYIRAGNNSNSNELKITTSGATIGGNTVWHAGNDGSGTGLDADTLDGQHGSSFLRSNASDSFDGTLSWGGSAGSDAFDLNNSDIEDARGVRAREFTQLASGVPRNNLGDPTVTEMALFDSQFRCMTDLSNNYNDLTDLRFYVQTTSASEWEEVTTYSDDQKRRFLRTNNSSVQIPNTAYKFRVEFNASGYTFANAMYFYWSSQSHSSQVHIWKQRASDDQWFQHTSSTNTVSSWPGHLWMPFSTIPWLEDASSTSTGHYHKVRVEFIPNWSGSATYGDRPIALYGGQIWGGYPSGRRTPHYYDQNGKLFTWGDFEVNGKLHIDTRDANTSSTTALVMNGNEVEQRTLGSAAFSTSTDFVAVSGDQMTGNLEIKRTVPVIVLNDSDATNTTNLTAYISLQTNGTEKGWVGYGSSGNSDLTLKNNDGRVVLNGSSSYVTSNLDVSGVITNSGGAKINVQNQQDGGTGRGIYMWDDTDTNWVIYMAQSGDGKAADGGPATAGIDGTTQHAIRFRVNDNADQSGFIWENSSDEALMQVTGDSGDVYARSAIYPSNQTTDFVNSTRIQNWQTAYGWGDHASSNYLTSVDWTDIGAATRTNYTLKFQPPASNYAGFQFLDTSGNGAGYFLVRGTSDNDVYTAEGITLVADAGWLTLAQRTTSDKGIKFMTGATAATRMTIANDGDININNSLTVGVDLAVNGNIKDNDYKHAGSDLWLTKKYIRSVGLSGGEIANAWVHLSRVAIASSYGKLTVKFTIHGYDDVSSGTEVIDAIYENGASAQENHGCQWYSLDNNANLFTAVRSIRSGSSGTDNTYDIYVQMAGDWRDTFTVVAEYWRTGTNQSITFLSNAGSASEPSAGTNDIQLGERRWYTENAYMYLGSNRIYTTNDFSTSDFATASHSHSAATTSAAGFMSSTDKTKLDGVATGAEVNVQSDWNATSGDSFIQNKPTTFAPSSHNHNSLYYTEDEIRLALARTNGWEAGYGSGTASNIKWNLTEEALELRHDSDSSIGAVYKAVWMEAGETKRWTVMIRGSQVTGNGMYIRLYQYDGNLPDGKTHVSNDAQGTFVQEDSRGDTGWYENGAISDSWTVFEREYKAPSAGYVSLVVLNWTGNGTESLFIKNPDIQTVYAKVESGSIGITELAVSDGTNGQVLTTNGSGTLSFATVSSGGADTNYYLDGITRTDATNTLVFSVNGADNQSYTFGANAFNSTTIPAAEAYTAHEDTSTLNGTYGSVANGTKIDEITVDANGHITNITTGATGNMTGFFVEDGDGTEVQINNANEWKFVEGAGISINWTDTNQGIDSDPYDLTIACTIDSPGEVGLANLSSSGNALAGTFTATGDLIAYSDARVKENVETIPNALEKVTALRGVNFNKIGEEKRSTGVIAQEVAEVIPEVVHESEDGMLGVAYGNITGLLIEAIKEQQKQIDELKAKLDGSTK